MIKLLSLNKKYVLFLLFILGAQACSKIDKRMYVASKTVDLDPDSVYVANLFPKDQRQLIGMWGHDIKQEGKAENLTVEACQQIFQTGRFNVLRIPFYSAAHNLDGSVRENYLTQLVSNDSVDNTVAWEKIPITGEWFYLKNIAHQKYLRAISDNSVEIEDTTATGNWTQWRLIDAGNGWFHLQSRGFVNKYLSGNNNNEVRMVASTQTGSWTQWKLIDAPNGKYYINNRGLTKRMKGGGNAYTSIIAAINRAIQNGNPDLYASHKIYDSGDFSTSRNSNFGPFYTTSGINTSGFAASIDTFLDYIYAHTGKQVKYLAPRCELGNFWTPENFVSVVNKLSNPPLIVGPEAAHAVNSESFWTPAVQAVVDIKSTHNKENAPLWPDSTMFDWDGETVGGSQGKFISLVFKLHEAFYKGGVTGIVFWGDTHLNNTIDDGDNGPFRRELVAASTYPLIGCQPSSDTAASVIGFETAQSDRFKLFYCSTKTVQFNFDQEIQLSSIPTDAVNITANSFCLPATGSVAYRSFEIELVN